MACWLFKEEPQHFSFERLQLEGETEWDGVRNSLALMHLRSVSAGDEILYYHTGMEKAVVGAATCTRAAAGEDGWPVIRAGRKFRRAVTLSEIKWSGRFGDSPLVRNSRLSVMPVDRRLREFILKRGGGEEKD